MDLQIASVIRVIEEEPGIQRLAVARIADGGGQTPSPRLTDGDDRPVSPFPAVCYTHLSGSCRPGDVVILNTTATDLELGTGGEDFVVSRIPEGTVPQQPSGGALGHIMKIRYTPVQINADCVEEDGSPFRESLLKTSSLDRMPVACCGLHSQVPLVASGIRAEMPDAKIVYCMTDGGSLMAWHSRIVSQCRDTGLVNICITCGQAIGGDLEAITLHSGLLCAAGALGADVAIVSIGPGVAGNATPFGNGGVHQAEAVNAAGALGGIPVAVARISLADRRERHRGVSHHFLEAIGTLALARCEVPVPETPGEAGSLIERQLVGSGISGKHDVMKIGMEGHRIEECPIEVKTMGRSPADDPVFFEAAFVAGLRCGRIANAAR